MKLSYPKHESLGKLDRFIKIDWEDRTRFEVIKF